MVEKDIASMGAFEGILLPIWMKMWEVHHLKKKSISLYFKMNFEKEWEKQRRGTRTNVSSLQSILSQLVVEVKASKYGIKQIYV